MKPYILLLPAALILVGVLSAAIFTVLSQSLGYFPVIGLTDITLEYYLEVLSDRLFLKALTFSLYTSIVSALFSVILGVVLAWAVSESRFKKNVEKFIFKLPVVVPHVVVVFLVFIVLSQSGMIARILYAIGVIRYQDNFPLLVFDKYGVGIILTFIWKGIPFTAMVVYSILGSINEGLSQAAANLGADRRQVFWHITVPLILPSVLSSFIIIFAFNFGAYEIPYLLGPTLPKALSVLAFIEYSSPELTNRPIAMVMNGILMLVSLVAIVVHARLFNILRRKL